MRPFRRGDRLGEELRKVLADIFLDMDDPLLRRVSLHRIEVRDDLEEARVFYSLLAGTDEDRKRVEERLQEVQGELRRRVGKELYIRKAPVFRFVYVEESEWMDSF